MSKLIDSLLERLNISRSVWLIFGLALLVRLWGIWYALPLQLNIDEPSLVSGTLQLKNSLNPGRFDWPSLYFYINASFYFLFTLIEPVIESIFKISEEDITPAAFFLISRMLSAVFGALTVFLVYLISRKMFSHRIGVIAGVILTFLPRHVYESHLAKIDIAHTFFVALAIYFIWNIYKYGGKWAYIVSGIAIGLATTIKYNGFLLVLPFLIAYFLRRSELDEKNWLKKYMDFNEIKYMVVAGITSIVVFYLGTPFALLDSETFFSTERGKGAMWQFQNVGNIEWVFYPQELYETFITMFRDDLGLVLWLVFSLLMILFVFFNKRSKENIFLLLPTLFITLYISRLDRSPSHYFLMLIPFYVPAVAKFVNEIYLNLKKVRFFNFINLALLLLLILLPSIWTVLKTNYMLSRLDTRNLAYNWIQDNLEESDFLFVVGEDLSQLKFKEKNTEGLNRLDRDSLNYKSSPFYVLIGVEGITKESLTTGDRDPVDLEGNSEPILKYADLMFSSVDELRFGPPIYIFKVHEVEKDN